MEFLHLARDEKFIDHVIRMFEIAAPGASRYVVYNRSHPEEISLIRQRNRVECIPAGSPSWIELEQSLGQYRAVLIHCAEKELAGIMRACQGRTQLVWLSWGVDIYTMACVRQHGPDTWRLLLTRYYLLLTEQCKFLLRPLTHRILLNPWIPLDPLLRGALGSDYCIPVIPEDYELFKRRFGRRFHARRAEFNYACIEDNLGAMADRQVGGRNILLGNSASSSCNHAEMFRRLKHFDLSGRQVITPLSYGSGRYRYLATEDGRRQLGDAFAPLTDFIPLAEYTEMLCSCSAVVMNHYRQQAVGNILPVLWLGARLYLNERNPLYAFLKRLELPVFSISRDLTPGNPDVFAPLPDAERDRARTILLREYGRDTVIERTRKLVALLRGDAWS